MSTIQNAKETIQNAITSIKLDPTDKTFVFSKPLGIQSDALLAYVLKDGKLECFKPQYIYFKDSNGIIGKKKNKSEDTFQFISNTQYILTSEEYDALLKCSNLNQLVLTRLNDITM